MASPQIFRATHELSDPMVGSSLIVKFNIEILNAAKDNSTHFLINFVHQSGSPDEYTSICEQIQDELDA